MWATPVQVFEVRVKQQTLEEASASMPAAPERVPVGAA